MKRILTFILFLSLSSSLLAQQWLWAKAEVNGKGPNSWSDGLAAATDNAGNIFQTGVYFDTNYFGPYLLIGNQIGGNVFLTKNDPSGNVLWARTSKGTTLAGGYDFSTSVATDAQGNAFITGVVADSLILGTYSLTASSSGTAFIAKYDGNGNVLWAKSALQQSSASNAWAYSVATDPSGNAFITGYFVDTVYFGTYKLTSAGRNVFIAKYDANGNVLWAACATPGNPFYSNSLTSSCVTTDNAGNAYISGVYADTVAFGSFNLPPIGNRTSAFIVKYSPGGTVLWAAAPTLPTNNSSVNVLNLGGTYVVSDGSNNVYFTGSYYTSLKFGNSYISCTSGCALFLAKYNSAGNALWAKTSTGSGFSSDVGPYSIAINKNKDLLYSCGTFADTLTFGSVTLEGKNEPSYILKFDTSGNALCGASVNNYNDDNNGIAIDPLGDNVYFTGDAYGDTCRFGSTLLSGTYEYTFLGKYTCASCSVNASATGFSNICQGSSTQLSASGGTSYLWKPSIGLNSNTISSPTATPFFTTTYTVTVTNGNCSAQDTVTVVVHPGPIVDVCCDSNIQPGQNVQLISSGGNSYNWYPPDGLSCTNCPNPVATPNQSTLYTVTINTDSGCTVQRQVIIDILCGQVFVPDAFSPNNDGQNDILFVRGDCIKTMDFLVFDRWGNKVFESENLSAGWDGTYLGLPMNMGTYLWYLKGVMNDGSLFEKKGNVTLVR